METAAFRFSSGSISHACSSLEKPGLAVWPAVVRSPILTFGKRTSSPRQARIVKLSAKTPETTVSSKSDAPLDNGSKSSLETRALRTSFPSAFEALLLEVCDETSVAEVQLKLDVRFLHSIYCRLEILRCISRGILDPKIAPVPVAPPVPSEPMNQSAPAPPSMSEPKPEKSSLFASASSAVSSKLASLEASGSNGFKLVTSPTVGSFHRGRTVKGKKQPPNCKQGDVIKEGQVIGYIDQFGTELPVKQSDVAGEVLKLLFEEGEAVGYGDPLIAVLPSFHGLR
ncbi:Biotin carboxyl carrier protein of acetyl-CoA carboxylase [Bienertia sinuspersici]